MSQAAFSYEREDTPSNVSVFRLEGRLQGHPECFALQEEVHRLARLGKAKVILSLSGVDKIDSTGVGILASIFTSLRDNGGRLLLAGLSPTARKVLGLAWFLEMIETADSVQAALQRLEQDA